MKTNILFYIPDVDQTKGGIRQYTINLLETIATFDDAFFHFYIYHNLEDSQVTTVIKRNANLTLVTDSEIYTKELEKNNFWRAKATLISQFFTGKSPYRFRAINELDAFTIEKSIHFIHVPYQYIPTVSSSVKIICTLHDVQELHFPSFFSASVRAYRAKMYLDCVEKSHKIVVSYQHIAEDLITYFDVPLQRIQVCLLNMKDLWFNKLDEKFLSGSLPNPYNNNFIMYPANFWKHKNHKRLIEAFLLFKNKTNSSINLVLTGNSENKQGKEIKDLVDNLNLTGVVIFAGILSENQLYATYKNAIGVVIPTLYEAGSFPLMESLIMGIPVICSNVTSLPETIGNEQFVFDPFDVNDMAEKITQLVTDKSYREQSLFNCKKMSTRIKETGAREIIKTLYNNE